MTDFMFFVFTEFLVPTWKIRQIYPGVRQFFFYPPIGFLIGMIILKFIPTGSEEDLEDEKE